MPNRYLEEQFCLISDFFAYTRVNSHCGQLYWVYLHAGCLYQVVARGLLETKHKIPHNGVLLRPYAAFFREKFPPHIMRKSWGVHGDPLHWLI